MTATNDLTQRVAEIAAEIRSWIELIEKHYPNAATLDCAPVLHALHKLEARLDRAVKDSTAPPPASARKRALELLARSYIKRGYTEDSAQVMSEYIETHEPAVFSALIAALSQQPEAAAECHCGTCTCDPNMTPAVRFDLSPAQQEGAIRDHLISLGWTPPRARQPAALDKGINVAGMKALDDLLDHIHEYGASAKDVIEKANAFARAVIARYASQQSAAVDEAMVERACRHWYTQWDTADQATKMLWAKTMCDLLTAAIAHQHQEPTT